MDLTRRGFAALAGAVAVSVHAQARVLRALLVGVSDYPGLPQENQLRGPRNDVERIRGLLQRRGFAEENVWVLADGVRQSRALPTRSAIMASIDLLEQGCRPGDFALLYFGGHGSQQPVPPNSTDTSEEADGFYEVFLPRDVSRLVPAPGSARVIENGMVDHELRSRVDRLAAGGTFVWAVFDTCHSATMVRSGSDPGIRYRYVAPSVLGYTEVELSNARRRANRPTTPVAAKGPAGEPPGQAVYFYASQTAEKAVEMPLPQGGYFRFDRRHYGAFSYALILALEASVPMTYRQLAQDILVSFAALNLQSDLTLSDRQKPAFGGTALDAPVFMQAIDLPPPQWAVLKAEGSSMTLQGGALNRLAAGAIVRIVGGPIARDSELVGYARVVSVDLTDSQAEWVAYRGRSVPPTGSARPGFYARLERPGADYALRVYAEVDPGTKGLTGDGLRALMQRLRSAGIAGVLVHWLDEATGADIVLRLERTRAIVLPRSLAHVPRLQPRDGLAEVEFQDIPTADPDPEVAVQRIAHALHRISRATNLFRMASQTAGLRSSESLGMRPNLSIHRGGVGTAEPLTPEMLPVLRHGDEIRIEITNTSAVPIDVNLIYINANFGVNCWPSRGRAPTLEAGSVFRLPSPLRIKADPEKRHAYGVERLLIVGMRQHPLKEDNNLAFLAQDGLSVARSRPDEVSSEDLQAFRDAGFVQHIARSGASGGPTPPGAGTVMLSYTLHVLPAKARV